MPFFDNRNFLEKRYLSNTDIDINAMMSSVTGETVNGTFINLEKERSDAELGSFIKSINNHVVFVQNIVKESKNGKLFKSAQMFLHNIACPSNNGSINADFLKTAFGTTQGLVELPIHTILKIGGMYDFYYYDDYEKDDKIDYSLINGLIANNGYDLYDDPIIKNKHYGTYTYDNKNVILATAPFVKPITPRHIDDSFGNSSDLFSKTEISKNYRDRYFDYDLNRYISLSNNIASHIPFSGYGVLNNYLNTMSYLFFGEGLDGGKDNTNNQNDNTIPYHIIGNFKGNLKTFKTYNDTQLNFLASYNSYGTKIEYDLNGLTTTLDTLTKTITLDRDFVFSKSPKKTEFFLILSKIKANYLGGYISNNYLYTLIKDLCAVKNLNAKFNAVELPDFTALLFHLLFHPDGAEDDNRRKNKTYRILSLYDVDPNSFMGVTTHDTNEYRELVDYLLDVLTAAPENQYKHVTYLLLSMWFKEFNTEKSAKLSAVDKDGTFVVYPSCGGEINIKELFSNTKYTYHKTNNPTAVITDANDLTNPYITGLTTSSFIAYDDINNDLISSLNFDYKLFYGYLANNKSINSPYTEFLDQAILSSSPVKYSEKNTVPKSLIDNDTFFLPKYDQVPYKNGLTTLNITNPTATSKLDRYDDLYIIANTTDPDAIKELNFTNKGLVNNTSKLFWFDQSRNIFPNTNVFRSPTDEHLKINKTYDQFEFEQFGLGDNTTKLYEWGDPLDINNDIRLYDYSKFNKDKDAYLNFGKSILNDIIDIFGFDKLEDFRSLFKNFSDTSTKKYFNQTFNTFDFQSIIKHTNIFGYTHLPDTLTLDGRNYTKQEISAILCGYSGYFIEFASKNDISKIINYALTIGQENKARIVIDEFMNAKITINNYSTGGSLYVDNTINNPEGLRLNSNLFNPIIMYSTDTRTPDSIISKLDYRLLFRTLLFGDQLINPYDVKTIPDNYNLLVEKYLGNYEIMGVEPNLKKTLLPELTRTFFNTLNIEITEGNLKLLLPHIKAFISTIFSKIEYKLVNDYYTTNIFYNATAFPSADGATDKEYDATVGDYIITNKIINGVFTKVNDVKYIYNTFSDLKATEKLKEYIDYYNKITLTKQIEAFNTGLKKFSELSKSKISGLLSLSKTNTVDELGEFTKSDIELRTGTYYRIKSLYDRSISFNKIDLNDTTLIKKTSKELANINPNDILNHPLFFNFNVETDDTDYENCYDKPVVADKNLKDLYDYAMVIDRGNNPYGTKVLANIDGLKKVIADDLQNVEKVDNTLRSKSMWTILSTLASDHEFLLLPLTSYVNLNGVVAESQDPFDVAHDMFGVFNNLEMFNSNPSFIFQLGSLTSNVSAGNKSKQNDLSEFDLSNTFCLDIESNQLDSNGHGKILNEGIPNDILNSNVSSFIVDFGNKNQNMFKNIELSTDEFANTEESIFTQVNLTSNSANVAQLSTGKLFTAMENRSYSCTVTSLGNVGIQPLTYFYVKNVPLFYGTYWITNVSHKISPNTMTTTFKGVRQPIAKKPTPNTAILKQLLVRAQQNAAESGYIDPANRVQTSTSGKIYAFQNRVNATSGSDQGFALFSQQTSGGKYANYSGLWITASYLRYMTNGDQNNTLLIKALISYLYNNASTICNSIEPSEVIKYFPDVIAYDMYNKLGKTDLSLSSFIKDNPTSATKYEEILLKFKDTPIEELTTFLSDDKSINGRVKTTLITDPNGKVVTNDASKAKVTFPNDISIPSANDIDNRDDFVGSAYWISDEKYYAKLESNVKGLQGFSIYDLTNNIFETKSTNAANPSSTGSINEVYTVMNYNPLVPLPTNIQVSGSLYNLSDDAWLEIYTPFATGDGYPKPNVWPAFAEYKKIATWNLFYKNIKDAATANSYVDSQLKSGNVVGVEFDPKVITPGLNGTYFAVVKYRNKTTGKWDGQISFNVQTLNNPATGQKVYVGNNPGTDSSMLVYATETTTVLGFGTTTGTTKAQQVNSTLKYAASFSDPIDIGGTKYVSDVLGAINNGKSYISFLSFTTEGDYKSAWKDRGTKSYIDTAILGNDTTPKEWTIITNVDIKQENIYKPEPITITNGIKKLIPGWIDPLKTVLITSPFGMRTLDGETSMHKGVDLRAKTPINCFSVLDGDVVFAGECDPSGWGRAVIIAHPNSTKNITTLYGHISATKVSSGTKVKAGDLVALTGEAGSADTKPHLHFEIREGLATDYQSYLKLNPIDPKPYLNNSAVAQDNTILTNAELAANQVEVKNYLKDKGWSKYEVAAAMGNMQTESRFNPNAGGQDANVTTTSNYGLIQWNSAYTNPSAVGTTVASQMNYMVEGGWKNSTDKFRNNLKQNIPTIKLDTSLINTSVTNLSTDELQAYIAAFIFARDVEGGFNCQNWGSYNKDSVTSNGTPIRTYERSENAVSFYKRLNDPNDSLKW